MEQNLNSQRTTLTESEKNQTIFIKQTSHFHFQITATWCYLYLTPPPASPLSKKTVESEINTDLCSNIHKRNHTVKLKSSKTPKSSHHFHLYHDQMHPLPLLNQEQSRPHFNLHLINYVQNTVSFTKEF